jgi:hypothetical protein
LGVVAATPKSAGGGRTTLGSIYWLASHPLGWPTRQLRVCFFFKNNNKI